MTWHFPAWDLMVFWSAQSPYSLVTWFIVNCTKSIEIMLLVFWCLKGYLVLFLVWFFHLEYPTSGLTGLAGAYQTVMIDRPHQFGGAAFWCPVCLWDAFETLVISNDVLLRRHFEGHVTVLLHVLKMLCRFRGRIHQYANRHPPIHYL